MLAASDKSSGRSLNLAECTTAPSIAYMSSVTTMNASGTRARRGSRGDGWAMRPVIESLEAAGSYDCRRRDRATGESVRNLREFIGIHIPNSVRACCVLHRSQTNEQFAEAERPPDNSQRVLHRSQRPMLEALVS